MPRKVKMKGVPKGAFSGMGDRVVGVESQFSNSMPKIAKGFKRVAGVTGVPFNYSSKN